ncbi:MAG: S41 family peptidase [Flavobacteriaceae bacterium]|nr:S41 family peptidase [Flavobacteriaceae bacterium]
MKTRFKKLGIITLLIAFLTITVSFKSDFFEIAKQIELYTSIFKELNMHYIDEVNPTQMTNNAVKNMLKNLDPYTKYYDEQDVEDYKIKSRGEYGGIGAKSLFKDNRLFIREVYEGNPAAKAGLKAGDEIIKINDIWVKDYEGNSISALLKGLPETKVSVKVKRNDKTIAIEITRETIEIDPVPFYEMIDDEVGYIAFVKFNKKAAKRVKEAYQDLKEEGMQKLIIDVRSNPGGLLNEVVKIVNYFVPKDQIVVTTKSKVKKWSNTYKTRQEPIDLEIPIVILVNGRSASASEILAGSLQDLDRAVIIGERSYGKGLVQRTRKLPYGTQIKLTISKYYTPSGRCIQKLDYTNRDLKTGIVPKFDAKNRNIFKTLNGRNVYDGGGIEPDIKVEKLEKTIGTKALFASDAIFKFATKYQHEHKTIANAANFILNDNDYQSFINFVKTEETTFKTETEKSFEKAFKKAENEKYNHIINSGYNQLLQQINTKKITDLNTNKQEVLERITDEILKQFYYKKGIYLNKFSHDKTIVKATNLLKNTKKYTKILQ